MKTRSAIAATLAAAISLGTAFSGISHAASQTEANTTPIVTTGAPEVKTADSAQTARMKKILSKLVRQDEFLDEAIETLESSNGNLSIHRIWALNLSLQLIKGDLDAISAVSQKDFPEIRPEPGVTTCAKTILSYSRSVSKKIATIGGLVAKTSRRSKDLTMRDAVSSKQGKKSGDNKDLTQILEEQKAMEKLASDIQLLKASSKKLNATSKWLYVASK
jgi:hypothetical protein